MSWKEMGLLLGALTLGNIAGAVWSQQAKWWVWGLLMLGAWVWGFLTYRRSKRRIAAAVAAPEPERPARVAALAEEEQALARLALGEVSSQQVLRVPVDGDVFEYPETPAGLRALIFWGCVCVSGLIFFMVLRDGVRTDALAGLATAIGFALLAMVLHYAERAEGEQIIVTPFGVVRRKPNGERLGILWREVVWVRNRPWLLSLEIYAADGRRIRVSYRIKRYPRFVELLVSARKWLDERAA